MTTYRCPARHTTKEDVYYFGDGIHKLFYERCCTEPVGKPGTLCGKHQKRFEGEYKTKDPRLLCQWNYVYHHGLIGEVYNPHTQMYGSSYYAEGLKKGWRAPKRGVLEKAVAIQKEVLDLAVSMQMKITDYIKTENTEPTPEQAPAKKEKDAVVKPRARANPKKRVQADQTSTSSSSARSAASTVSGSSASSSSAQPMYIPKGPVAYAEAEDDPIIITAAQISTLIIHMTTADNWVDAEGQHYRKTVSGLIVEVS